MSVTVRVLPVANYAGGTRSIGPISIANDVTRVGASILRCTSGDLTLWPLPTQSIALDFEASYDGGQTWEEWFNASDVGGLVVSRRTGVEIPAMEFEQSLRPGTNRRIRGTITLSEAIKTGADFTVT